MVLKCIVILFFSCTSVLSQTIHEYSKNGNIKGIEQLNIICNSDYDVLNENGYTPLMLASYYGHTDLILFLLLKEVNVNATSEYGTALMAATVKGHKDIVLLLLEEGADPDIPDKNMSTALHFTALFGKNNIAETLLKYGSDGDIKDFRGNRALDYAILKKNTILIKLLNTYK